MWKAILALLISVFAVSATADDVPRMTKDELKGLLGTPELVLIDARYGKDWEKSDEKIAGAVREDPTGVPGWAGKYLQGKTIVVYCA